MTDRRILFSSGSAQGVAEKLTAHDRQCFRLFPINCAPSAGWRVGKPWETVRYLADLGLLESRVSRGETLHRVTVPLGVAVHGLLWPATPTVEQGGGA